MVGNGLAGVGSRRETLLWVLLGTAVIFGGGGRSAPLANLVVQLVAVGCLAFALPEIRAFVTSGPRLLLGLVTVSLLLPLLHAVPLPPAIWTALPGRDLVTQSLDLIGRTDAWMPLSVDPSLSLLAFIGLMPPLAVLVLAWDLPAASQGRLVKVLLGLTALVLLVGAVQLASAGGALDFYTGGSAIRLAGTFANHNSTGLFLVLMMCLLVCHRRRSGEPGVGIPFMQLGLGLMLVIGVALTQSRSSIALLLIPATLLIFRLWGDRRAAHGNRRFHLWLAAAVLVVVGLATVLLSSGKLGQSLERFDNFDDLRPAIWSDGLVSADRFWPVGSGMGTFDEVFQVDESLENVTPRRAGRAHNDYLEIAIEAGVGGLLLVAFWVGYLLWVGWRSWHSTGSLLIAGCSAGLLCIAAQSVLDYPLRNEALFCIAALLVAFLHVVVRDGAKRIDGV